MFVDHFLGLGGSSTGQVCPHLRHVWVDLHRHHEPVVPCGCADAVVHPVRLLHPCPHGVIHGPGAGRSDCLVVVANTSQRVRTGNLAERGEIRSPRCIRTGRHITAPHTTNASEGAAPPDHGLPLRELPNPTSGILAKHVINYVISPSHQPFPATRVKRRPITHHGIGRTPGCLPCRQEVP